MRPRFVWQQIRQIAGLFYAAVQYDGKFPDKDTHRAAVEYSLPFAGKWVAVNGGIDRETSHSWDIYPQRYAYDFLILDEEGSSHSGDRSNTSSYYCYGKEVLAPADGTVVAAYGHVKDSRIMDDGQIDPSVSDLSGNRIVIQHAEHEFSALCHLMPGSIAVQTGQQVRRGEPVARCGNSGNTSEPHLHFQVQNTKAFYSSLGLPIRFKDLRKAPARNYEKFDPRPVPDHAGLDGHSIARGLTVENEA
ncbi:MAG TPA: M23 family metallopeptidase [Clostridia bacterium]|nr:M23 family metallopeptidase [Clostridia bacterium]